MTKMSLILSLVLAACSLGAVTSFRIMKNRRTDAPLKILCLHGGGQTVNGFRGSPGLQALQRSVGSNYEFVFVSASDAPGNSGANLWIRGPPGGKDEPTTDPDWAAPTVNYLDSVVQSQGPFYGILGYSQGSAFAGFYVARRPGTFQVAMLFCGYIPTTHLGLTDTINSAAPLGVDRALVFMGERDSIISNGMTREQASKFTSPVVVVSSGTGHNLPQESDPTFSQVVTFLTGAPFEPPTGSPVPMPKPKPTPKPMPKPAPKPMPKPTPGSCPSFAAHSKPDERGDCMCPYYHFCTISGKKPDCPFSKGVGDKGGRFLAEKCTDCKCQKW